MLTESRISAAIKKLGLIRLIVGAWFVFVGWTTWEVSPINGGMAISFFIALAYFTYLLKPHRYRYTLVIVFYILTIAEILTIATWHDLTITSYACAQCCDGSYSFSDHRQGSCSWHNGVCAWNPEIPPWWKTL